MAYTIVDNPELYFQVKTYAGNNSGSGQAITFDGSENMQPDLVWVKCRDVGHSHTIYDSVRTSPAKYFLKSDDNIAERTVALGSFDSNGVTFTNNDGFNNGSGNYIIWGWKANGSGSSNSDGSITSTVSANTTSGFSIVKYTGTGSAGTVGHGLSSAPVMIINKKYNTTENWFVYHKSLGNNKSLQLNSTGASYTTGNWGNTDPTSSVFSLSTTDSNTSGATYINYCFTEKKGFSKFGSYTANSNSSNFIYTGMKPAFLMVKQTESGGNENWGMFDNKRPGYNSQNGFLYANTSGAEDTSNATSIDLLSNGFCLRANTVGSNPGKSYIFMAFAENPFVTSTGIPTTAR